VSGEQTSAWLDEALAREERASAEASREVDHRAASAGTGAPVDRRGRAAFAVLPPGRAAAAPAPLVAPPPPRHGRVRVIDLRSVADLARAAAGELAHHLTAGARVHDNDLCPRGPSCGNFGRDSCTVPIRCLRRDRCADAVELDVKVAPGKKKPKLGAPADRPLCDRCERAVATALDEVPGLWLDLENALPHRDSTGGSQQPVGKTETPGSPLGVNPRALHLQETVHQLLTTWEDVVRDTAGLSPVLRSDEDPWESRRPEQDRPRPKRRPHPGRETVAAARLLRTYLTAWVVHTPVEYAVTRTLADPDDPRAQPTDETQWITQAGWQAAAALLDWKAQVRATLGVTKLVIRRDEPCMYCQVKAVVEENGEDRIWCEACGQSWTREEYHGKVRGFQPYLRKLAKPKPKPKPAEAPAATAAAGAKSTAIDPERSAGGQLHSIVLEQERQRAERERMSR
jgi:hypothetical protein